VALQLGQYLRRLHSVPLAGFGFMDTDRLARTGELHGLDISYPDYFHKRFDDHLGYLRQHELLTADDAAEVCRQFARHRPRLQLAQGFLVHRDMAFWNVLGTPDRITAIIDWDDAVSGDPADDLGILGCFYDDAFMDRVLHGYWGTATVPDDFRCRVWLHTLRNMLWKTQIRHNLGYFDKGGDFFLNTPGVKRSLREHTLDILHTALTNVRSCANP
jgi:aminoglycoside phosphotransferase (APT) family kinase protein